MEVLSEFFSGGAILGGTVDEEKHKLPDNSVAKRKKAKKWEGGGFEDHQSTRSQLANGLKGTREGTRH